MITLCLMGCSGDGGQGKCGDGRCTAEESRALCPEDCNACSDLDSDDICEKMTTVPSFLTRTRETLTETVSGIAATRAPLMPPMTKMVTGFVGVRIIALNSTMHPRLIPIMMAWAMLAMFARPKPVETPMAINSVMRLITVRTTLT